MTPYFKGAMTILGLIVLGLLALAAFAGVDRAVCKADNYTAYAFEKCAPDKGTRCFFTPNMIEAYSRALEDMDSRECEKWEIEEEVVIEVPRFHKPGSAPDEGEKGA